MKINEVIRKKRKELNLTQERIADILGVSAPAVNKWESGSSYPDITLLAPLARILEIDMNTLFAFQEDLPPEDVEHLVTEILSIKEEQGFQAAFARAERIVRNYPNSIELIGSVALVMNMSLAQEKMEDKTVYEQKLHEWMVLVADSGEEKFADSALIFLCNEELAKKNFAKAQEYLDRISERKMLDKRISQANLYIEKGDLVSACVIYESKIYENVNSLVGTLCSLAQLRCMERDYDTALKIADLTAVLGEEFFMGNYQKNCTKLLVLAEMKRTEEVMELLWEMVSDRDALSGRKSYLNEHLRSENGISEDMLKAAFRQMLDTEEMDFLRKDVRFQQLVKRLEE